MISKRWLVVAERSAAPKRWLMAHLAAKTASAIAGAAVCMTPWMAQRVAAVRNVVGLFLKTPHAGSMASANRTVMTVVKCKILKWVNATRQ